MRVVGGRLGGRTLRAPRGSATRPTTDRVRESLFQILGDLTGLSVADLYAGTGALGIEALSRGARWVTFVESNRPAAKALRENLETLGLGASSQLVVLPVERAAAALGAHAPYDLILADPPWAEIEHALRTLTKLLSALPLPEGGRLVIEHAARDRLALPPGFPLALRDSRSWGDTAVSLFSAPTPGKG